jgi:hypothetical protein
MDWPGIKRGPRRRPATNILSHGKASQAEVHFNNIFKKYDTTSQKRHLRYKNKQVNAVKSIPGSSVRESHETHKIQCACVRVCVCAQKEGRKR